eukprot:506348_1
MPTRNDGMIWDMRVYPRTTTHHHHHTTITSILLSMLPSFNRRHLIATKRHIHTQINESVTPDQTRAPFSDIPPTNASSVPHGTPLYTNEATKSGSKHEVKLLYRQIDNIKDEMEGISKHLDLTKTYLKTMMNCLESSVLLMNELDTNQIFTLCSNARQFLGIEQPPPAAKTSHTPPMLPQEHSAEPPPLPKEDERDEILVPMPREPTPPLKVSNIERMPISVPKVLHHSPSPPPCMPSDDYLNKMPPPIPHMKQPKSIIKHNAILPSVPEKPVKPPPNAPHIPLPPPQTHSKVKLHHTGVMPSTVTPSLPPTQPQPSIPSIPQEVIPNTKRFSSAKPPASITPDLPPPQAPA